MAYDAFLKLDGVKGESKDAQHKDEIDILSFSLGASQTGAGHVGGGSGAGKVQIHSFTVTKKVDRSSTDLWLRCANGTHYSEGVVVMRKAGLKPLDFLTYKFTEVYVDSIQWSGTQAGDDHPIENVSFSFATMSMEYKEQGPTGAGKTAGQMGWNIKANVPL